MASAECLVFYLIFRKLRDEYDKLEGALRKLGVDATTMQASGSGDVSSAREDSEVI